MFADAETLYREMYGWLYAVGYNMTDEADHHLAEAAKALHAEGANALLDIREKYGEHAHWQCFTKRANDLMQQMFEKLVQDLRTNQITRLALPTEINERLNAIEKLCPNEGIWDTEPQVELATRLSPVLEDLGYRDISRWEW